VRQFGKPRIADYLRITVGTETEIGRLLGACRAILDNR